MHFDFSKNNKLSFFVVSCRCYRHSPACASLEFSRLRLEYKEIKLGISVRRTLEHRPACADRQLLLAITFVQHNAHFLNGEDQL